LAHLSAKKVFHLRKNTAEVEYVIGELYWKVEVGETVAFNEWEYDGELLTEERTGDEVVFSYAVPIGAGEIANAFAGNELRGTLGWGNPSPGCQFLGCLIPLLWLGLFFASCVVPANEKVFESNLEIPAPQPVYDDDHIIVGDKTCASWRASGETVPAACQPGEPPDRAVFTPTFEVTRDKKNVRIVLEVRKLDNLWVGADVALIDDERGYVYEGELDEIEEGASGGKQKGSLVFGRIPQGRYLVRVDPAWGEGKREPRLRLIVRSDSADLGHFFASWVFYFIVFVLWFIATVFCNTEKAKRVVLWLACIAAYGILGLLAAHVFFGYSFSPKSVSQIPESVRSSPGGYRSWAFWHAGMHGGK